MSINCHQCDADEFHRDGNGDWVCSNGHLQNWTVVPDPAADPDPTRSGEMTIGGD